MRNAYAVKPDPRLSWGGLQHPASDLSPARCMSSNWALGKLLAVASGGTRGWLIFAGHSGSGRTGACSGPRAARLSRGLVRGRVPAGCQWRVYLVIFVVVAAVLLPVRGPGVTLVMFAWSRRVPVLALTVTVMWTRQAAPALRVARWHCTVAPPAPVRGIVQCPRPAFSERNVVLAGRWPPSLSCHAADGPLSVIVMV